MLEEANKPYFQQITFLNSQFLRKQLNLKLKYNSVSSVPDMKVLYKKLKN